MAPPAPAAPVPVPTAPSVPGGGTPPPEIMPTPGATVAPTSKPGATAPAGPSPSPSLGPTASPAPTKTPAGATPSPTPGPDSRAVIDALPQSEVQEAINLLKTHYIKPDVLSDAQLSRATLQGLLARIGGGAVLLAQGSAGASSGTGTVAGAAAAAEASPFYAEAIEGRAGYLRLGDLSRNHLGELDAALREKLKGNGIKAIVLDLRATGASSDFELAAEVIRRFCPKGKPLFTLRKSGGKGDRMFTSNMDPLFQGFFVVLADESVAGAPEAIASVLRAEANALVVGEKTSGRAYEFAEVPLRGSSFLLRIAVAEVVLPDGQAMPRDGVKPDIDVEMSDEVKREVLLASREKGIAATITDLERIRMNEAALVAGRNPEIEALQAAQRARAGGADRPKSPTIDVQLQRAVDLVTTVSLFDARRARK